MKKLNVSINEYDKVIDKQKGIVTINGEEWEIVDSENIDDNEYEYMEVEYDDPEHYTYNAIDMLLKAGIKTNIHYVLGNNSIDEAIDRVKNNKWPEGINAIIFLLHKPIGLGKDTNVLNTSDPRVKEFYELIDSNIGKLSYKIGFDSCNVPGILNFTHNIDGNVIDTCEAARFSGYITSDMKMLPCSFDNQALNWAVDLNTHTIQEAWDSEIFEDFRNHFRNSCPNCKDRLACLGGCPITRKIVLCNREEKRLA